MADTRTLGNLIDRIADELKRDDLGSGAASGNASQASIKNAVFDAIYEYQREHFFQNEAIDESITTVQGNPYYFPPDDFISLLQLDIIINGTVYTMIWKPYQQIDTMDALATNPPQGVPTWYAFYQNQVRLYPTPNAGYPLRFIYQSKIPAPVNAGDVSWWTTDAESLIRNRAKWQLNMEVLRDQATALLDKQRELEALRKLMQETAQKLFTGSLTSTRF